MTEQDTRTDAIAALEQALQMARDGDILDVAIIALTRDGPARFRDLGDSKETADG